MISIAFMTLKPPHYSYYKHTIYFSSLIKMVFAFALDNRCIPLALQLEHAVRRNFSGLEELDTWEIFKKGHKKHKEKNMEEVLI